MQIGKIDSKISFLKSKVPPEGGILITIKPYQPIKPVIDESGKDKGTKLNLLA